MAKLSRSGSSRDLLQCDNLAEPKILHTFLFVGHSLGLQRKMEELEQVTGFEPASLAWKAKALPLDDTCIASYLGDPR